MERLTALAVPRRGEPFLVVPRLEAPMVDAGPAGGLGLELLAWDETDDPFALLARAATERLGAAPTRVAVGGAHLGRARARRPAGAARVGAGARRARSSTGCAWSSRRPRSRSWPLAGRGDRPGARPDGRLAAGRAAPRPRSAPTSPRRSSRRATSASTSRSSAPARTAPARTTSSPAGPSQAGDVVVVDIGGETATGYRSDCTRTYVVGGAAVAPRSPSGTRVLQAAQEAAVAAVRPGRDRRGRRRRGPRR